MLLELMVAAIEPMAPRQVEQVSPILPRMERAHRLFYKSRDEKLYIGVTSDESLVLTLRLIEMLVPTTVQPVTMIVAHLPQLTLARVM